MAFHTPGGGEIQLLAYKKHLEAKGIEISLFDPWNPRFAEHDAVHFFSCVGGSSHFCNFVKGLGLPLVVSASLWVTEATAHQYPMGEIAHQFSLANLVVTNSELECETLSQVFDQPREHFAAVLNGVEDFFYEPIPANIFRDHFAINGPFILNVGNIEPRKNQLGLVRAMHEFPEYQLVLIGHQRDAAYARQCLDEGGSQVTYLGPLQHDSPLLRSAYSACSVFCLPSTLETPGLAALEAYAAGCRIAVTEIGSTREYFGDDVAYLNPDDRQNIAQAVHTALRQRASTDRPPAPRDFRWNSVVDPLISLYNSVIRK